MGEDLRQALAEVLNRYSVENGSNTSDFILAEFLVGCLAAFDLAVSRREQWYGRDPRRGPAGMIVPPAAPPESESKP